MNIIVGRNGKATVNLIANAMCEVDIIGKYFLKNRQVWRKNGNKMEKSWCPTTSGMLNIFWGYNPSDMLRRGLNANGIALSSNKPLTRKVLRDKGIPVPETTEDIGVASSWTSDGIVIGRPVKHRSGTDFFVCRTQEDVENSAGICAYWSKFFRKTKEFRVHAGSGKVLFIQEKVSRGDVDYDIPQPWNHSTGNFVFKTVDLDDYDANVARNALKAIDAVGLDFGAVDILYSPEGSVVCEINTSPSLCEYSLSKYVKYFNYYRNNINNHRVDYNGFKKGRSFAWKNYQLNAVSE